MLNIYDAVIAGAGPAGSAAAIRLGQHGKKVLLLDKKKFPRDKTCGDGITYKALPMLKKLDVLDDLFNEDTFKSHGYTLIFNDNSKLSVEFPDSYKKPIYIISRNKFDNKLLAKALSFPTVDFESDVDISGLSEDKKSIVSKGGKSYSGKMIVDATGANSILARNNRDIKSNALAVRGYYNNVKGLDHTIHLYFSENILPGYFWVFPTSDTTANVGGGTFMNIVEDKKINLKEILHEFVTTHPIASKYFADATLIGRMEGGKIPLAFGDFTWPRIKGNLIPIGDAGGFVNPITAEGISYAIATGIFAADAISDYVEHDEDENQLKQFSRNWQTSFSHQYKMGDIYNDPLQPDSIRKYVMNSLNHSVDGRNLNDPADTYEYLVKLKVLTKSF